MAIQSFSTLSMIIAAETYFYFTRGHDLDFVKSYLAPSNIIDTKSTL